MRSFIKKILFPFLNSWYKIKSRRVVKYSKHGINLKVYPSVFHPGFFLSTNIFIEFISELNLKNKRALELGAGSGMISFYMSKKGAKVTASDINDAALKGLIENSKTNNLHINVVKSNLFDKVSPNDFDYIIINPPYYPKAPKNIQEIAFYCGKDFEYFNKLFSQLKKFPIIKNNIYMILSEDCEISQIKTIANKESIDMKLIRKKKKMGEQNYIFKIAKSNS